MELLIICLGLAIGVFLGYLFFKKNINGSGSSGTPSGGPRNKTNTKVNRK